MSFNITRIHARQILDSRGNPTVEVDAYTDNFRARAAVPSGASTGVHEALELRDGGSAYLGKGVLHACQNVNQVIAPKLIGMDCRLQLDIDNAMLGLDGTENKKRLGANAMLAVSLAVSRLAADASGKALYEHLGTGTTLPVPCMNIINGGAHAENKLPFQEYMIVPLGRTFSESLQIGSEIYHTLKKIIKDKYGKASANVGDEGGFAPNINQVKEPPRLIMQAAAELGYSDKVRIAMDVAASEFYDAKKGYLVDDRYLDTEGMIKLYEEMVDEFPIVSIEDPFDQDDFDSFARMTQVLGKRIQIVGDDHLVTNPKRIQMAFERKSCNALLMKVNQIGTLTEAIAAAKMARQNGWNVMVSHRSGETEDSFIADMAVGLGLTQIKSGAPCRSERTAKYNQLLRIEEHLGSRARFAGTVFR